MDDMTAPDSSEIPDSTVLWELIDLQDCLHDSPQFRHLLEAKEKEMMDLERKLQKVVQSCTKLIDAGQTYIGNCRLFGLSLKELAVHFSQQPTVADALFKFCDLLNEVQSFYSILFDQAQRTVTKGIKSFLTGELKKAHDSKKTFDRLSEDLNNVIHKNAAVSRHKPAEAEEVMVFKATVTSQLQTTLAEFTHQALDYSYQINVISCSEGHHIAEKILSFMNALSTYYHQGYDSFKLLDPYFRNLAQQLDAVKQQSDTDIKLMEDRHSLVSTQHLHDSFPNQPLLVLDNPSLPVELSGYLFKRASNAFKLWNRRYFELRDNKLLYLRKDSADMDYAVVADDLRICTVKLAEDLERRYCFEVVTPTRSCMLQADTEALRKKWCHYLESAIARALRTTSSNKTREAKESRHRLTSSTTAQSTASNLEPVLSLDTRSETPSSLNSYGSVGLDFLETAGNDKCADCSNLNPKWASLNHGVLLCIDCSGIHRSLGVHISKVKSLTLDDWEPEHQKIMCALGNSRINGILEFDVPEHVKKLTPASSVTERESFIRLKYVSHAFVHPHPDFERPDVPVPPRKIQGTLMQAAAASPKLGAEREQPVSMTTHSSHSPSPISPIPSSSDESGGLQSEKIALLEANLKKLEKSGKLQQWNLGRMYSVVRRTSPRKTFSFTRFTRPGSFRRKKSPLVPDDNAHSDNELESSMPLLGGSPNIGDRPPKPPRTYTTTVADMDASPSSLFPPEEEDTFSSDLLNTLKRLGSVYSITGMGGEEVTRSQVDLTSTDEIILPRPHANVVRSLSALGTINTPPISDIPIISVSCDSPSGEESIVEEEPKVALNRELSYSDTSLHHLHNLLEDYVNPVTADKQNGGDNIATDDDHTDNEEEDEESLKHTLSQSSIDSFQSAEGDVSLQQSPLQSPQCSPQQSPTPLDLPDEGPRPESVASEFYHTPPNSVNSSPPGTPDLETVEDHVTSMGISLGLKVTLDEPVILPSDESSLKRAVSSGTVTDVSSTVTEPPSTVTEPPSTVSNTSSNFNDVLSLHEEDQHKTLTRHKNREREHDEIDEVFGQQSLEIDPSLLDNREDDLVIIPDHLTPTKYIFECSLSADIPGILCGLVHGGQISAQDPDEGQRYPVHQACIAGDETVVEFLYLNGAKVNVSDGRGLTPLHLAVMNDDASLAAALLRRGAMYEVTDHEGKTPLVYAIEKQNADIVTLLKLSKVNAEAKSEESDEAQRFMEETMAGVYKDFSMTAITDPERMKRHSLSSNTSTPSFSSSGEEATKTASVTMATNKDLSTSNGLTPSIEENN